MPTPNEIKTALDRAEKVFTARPENAQLTKVSVTKWEEGLRCVSSEGGFEYTTDMPEPMGGEGSGAYPGALARSALGACAAIGYAMVFARRGIPFTKLSVSVEADIDLRGLFGMEGAPKGPSDVRCIVDLESSADKAEINRALDDADANSPVGNIFVNATPVRRSLNLNSGRQAAE